MDIHSWIATALSVIGIASTIYFSDKRKINLWRDKYKGLYGEYRLYNYSRERSGLFHEWEVSISRRFLLAPKFRAQYSQIGGEEHVYEGDVIIADNLMTVDMRESRHNYHDRSYMVFPAPNLNKINILSGILCGFRLPIAPYAGVHVLCAKQWTREEIKALFPPPPTSDNGLSEIDAVSYTHLTLPTICSV